MNSNHDPQGRSPITESSQSPEPPEGGLAAAEAVECLADKYSGATETVTVYRTQIVAELRDLAKSLAANPSPSQSGGADGLPWKRRFDYGYDLIKKAHKRVWDSAAKIDDSGVIENLLCNALEELDAFKKAPANPTRSGESELRLAAEEVVRTVGCREKAYVDHGGLEDHEQEAMAALRSALSQTVEDPPPTATEESEEVSEDVDCSRGDEELTLAEEYKTAKVGGSVMEILTKGDGEWLHFNDGDGHDALIRIGDGPIVKRAIRNVVEDLGTACRTYEAGH